MSNSPEVSADDIRRRPLADRKIAAKELYFNYKPVTEIARNLDIKLPTVKTWVYGLNSNKSKGWKVERELAKNQLLKDLSKDKRGMVYNMVDGALFLLYDYVDKKRKEVIQTGIPVSVRDADKITNMLMNLSKIVENENDSSDDANFTAPTNPKELQQRAIKADPFAQGEENEDDDIIIDADVVTVK